MERAAREYRILLGQIGWPYELENIDFSPDGKWFVTSSTTAFRFWQVGTWQLGLELTHPGSHAGPMALSRDGRIFAMAVSPSVVEIIQFPGRELLVNAEFLAAYHTLNRCYADLLEITRKQINDPARGERAALRKIETALPSQVHTIAGADVPYWIMVAGGKYDFTITWWHFRRYQAVIDDYRERILFVQAGEKGGYHPPLSSRVCPTVCI